MPEGLDRNEDTEEPAEANLEDIREEFLEKYGEGVGSAEASESSDGTQPENDHAGGEDHAETHEPDSNEERDGVQESAPHDDGASSPGAEVPQTTGSEPETEPREEVAADGSDVSLEEFREEALEKYGRLGEELGEGSGDGEPEAGAAPTLEESDGPAEEGGHAEPPEQDEPWQEPSQPEDALRSPETSDLNSTGEGSGGEEDVAQAPSVMGEEDSLGRAGDDPPTEVGLRSVEEPLGEAHDQATERLAPADEAPESVSGKSNVATAETESNPVVSQDDLDAERLSLAGTESIERDTDSKSSITVDGWSPDAEVDRAEIDAQWSEEGDVEHVSRPELEAEVANATRNEVTSKILREADGPNFRDEASSSTDYQGSLPGDVSEVPADVRPEPRAVAEQSAENIDWTPTISEGRVEVQGLLEVHDAGVPTESDSGQRTLADVRDVEGPNLERSELRLAEPKSADAAQESPLEVHRELEAVDYGKGAVLRVPKTDLEREGFEPEPGKNGIVKLGLRDMESEEGDTAFARYNGSDRRAEVYVGDIGGEKGSRYELVEASRYDEDGFVKDFERGKCEHLENVRLEHANEKLFLNVDDRRVELEDYRLSTSGSHAILRGKLDGEDGCKIEIDRRRASVRFGRDYPVEGMRMDGDELVVRYAQSKNEMHEHRMYLEHLETPQRPSLNQFDKSEMLEHVEMFDHPERIEGVYQFELSKDTQNEIRRLLAEAEGRGENEYAHMKAEISERLVPNMLELVGWEKIERHPFGEKTREGASARGTDWVMWTPDQKLAMMEIKWYENSEDGIRKGESQVAKNFDEGHSYRDSKLGAAYIAIVDWKVNDDPVKVYVKRVRPKEMQE